MDTIVDPAIDISALTRPHARYPYLVVRLLPAVYGIAELGRGLSRERLIAIACQEYEAHDSDLAVFLVLSEDETLRVGHEGQLKRARRPWGGRTLEWTLVIARLAPALRSVRESVN